MYAHHHILLYIYIHTYVRYILVSNIVLIHYLQSTIWTQQSPNRQVQILPSLPSQQPKPRRRSPNDPKKRSRSAKSQKSWGIGPGNLFECKIKGKLPGFKCLNIVIKEGESHWVDETNTRIQETKVFPRTYMEKNINVPFIQSFDKDGKDNNIWCMTTDTSDLLFLPMSIGFFASKKWVRL